MRNPSIQHPISQNIMCINLFHLFPYFHSLLPPPPLTSSISSPLRFHPSPSHTYPFTSHPTPFIHPHVSHPFRLSRDVAREKRGKRTGIRAEGDVKLPV